MSELVELSLEVIVNPADVSALEHCDGGYFEDGWGTIVTLKNGRKILVRRKNVSEIKEMLERPTPQSPEKGDVMDKYEEALELADKLEEVLKFYADSYTYGVGNGLSIESSPILQDDYPGGAKARSYFKEHSK